MKSIDLDSLVLRIGRHETWEDGACLLEATSYMAGEPFTDEPVCVCEVLATFGRAWNDSVDDAFRQRLKPFIPRLIGTANDGHAETRAWLCTDWLVRVQVPAWLRLIAKTDCRAVAGIGARPVQPHVRARRGYATTNSGHGVRRAFTQFAGLYGKTVQPAVHAVAPNF